MADGSTQLLDILLPGDLIGLSALLLDENRYGVRALTAVSVCMLDGHCITALYQEHAALGLDLLAARLREQERADARIAMLARLSAPARTGYLLLEVRDRLRQRGLARGVEWEFPLRRGEIADAVGLSKVHLMRALRDLRARGLAQLEGRRLRIPNVAELARFSGYVAARATPPLAIL